MVPEGVIPFMARSEMFSTRIGFKANLITWSEPRGAQGPYSKQIYGVE